MTAIIGILNRAAVALAGDSAATVDDYVKTKVYNNTNKIFHLTPANPVGISIYGSIDLNGIPWETIIKMYRAQFSINGFNELHEYGDDFLSFLNNTVLSYVTEDEQKGILSSIAFGAINETKIDWEATLNSNYAEELKNGTPDRVNEILSTTLNSFLDKYIEMINSFESLQSFTNYTKEEFIQQYEESIYAVAYQLLDFVALSPDHLEKIKTLVYITVCKNLFYEGKTGLVISGFGEIDVFLRLVSYEIGGIISSIIRYIKGRESIITNSASADVVPFAQTDSIWSFLWGISSKMQHQVEALMSQTLQDFNQIVLEKLSLNRSVPIAGQMPVVTQEQSEVLIQEYEDAAADLLANFQAEVNRAKQLQFHRPILNTLVYLSKEDMAEMAESLINLSYLQRRVSFADESVGGPVDVALITKGDGFIWIKRKHYFKPESNLNYLASILKG